MGRRGKKKGLPVNGWLVLDKPLGETSTRALARAKRIFNAQKAGHAGTLDPLATGILPIAFGEATKTVPYVVDGAKSYRFAVKWGQETETDDAEGAVVASSDKRPSTEEIQALLSDFTGEISQVPPQYSAIKVDGNRAYDLARDGEEFALEARTVRIDELKITDTPAPDRTVLEAACGKGTYVRAIARDLGRRLGCYGHVVELRRLRVGPFDHTVSVTLETLEQAAERLDAEPSALDGILFPVETALQAIPSVTITPSDAASLVRGQAVLLRGRDAPILTGPLYATCRGQLVALGEMDKGALRPTRVFNL